MSSRDAPLRIGFYATALPESGVSNGIVTYTGIMRDALRALGHYVMIVTPDHVEQFNGTVVALQTSRGIARRLRAIAEGWRGQDGLAPIHRLPVLDAFEVARRAGVQVFEIEESFGWARRLVGRGPAIVERLHGPYAFGREEVEPLEERKRGELRESAELESWRVVQGITCPSRRLLEAVLDRYSLQLPLVRAIPNPVPVHTQKPSWTVEQAKTTQLLFVGRFDLRKGADLALRAFERALACLPSLNLVMIGPDSGLAQLDGTKMHFGEFVRKEVAPQARARVHFMGEQSQQTIAELRMRSGFGLAVSRFENFPYSIAESSAFGMPVLASDSFGNTELIRDGLDGQIVPVGDIDATANAIVQMASDPEGLATMSASGFARVSEWLSPERIARETVALYYEALARL